VDGKKILGKFSNAVRGPRIIIPGYARDASRRKEGMKVAERLDACRHRGLIIPGLSPKESNAN
jgi:hypothetical protein